MRKHLKDLLLLASFFCILSPHIVFAATSPEKPPATDTAKCSSGSFLGLPTWYKYLPAPTPDESGGCNVDFNAETDIPKVVFALIEILTTLLGVIAVAMVVWGAFQYITSQGEPEATKHARQTIINALIGVGIAVSATAIVKLIGNVLF